MGSITFFCFDILTSQSFDCSQLFGLFHSSQQLYILLKKVISPIPFLTRPTMDSKGDYRRRSDSRDRYDSRGRADDQGSFRREDQWRDTGKGRDEERYRERRDVEDYKKGGGREDEKTDSRRRRERSRSRSPRRRSRSHSRSRDDGKEKEKDSRHRSSRRRSRSRSRSSRSDSSSGSDSEDSRDRKHRKKHKKSKSKDKDGKDSKGRDKEERRKIRQERKDKKERKERKKKGFAVVEWGKHGIIAETDIYTKDQEFRAWLVEEKMLNPETLSKAKEKEIFKSFMEEYNTGTLPHDKFYDVSKYEARMNAVRMGETVSNDDGYDPNKDLEDLRQSHKRAPVETETYLNRTKLEELRRVANERVEMERMKRLGMQPRESMGVRMDEKI